MPRLLKDLQINDVSSVDRGAGDGVKVLLMKRDDDEPYWKRDFSQEQRDDAADSGAALPDGSFPIKSKQDLRNAVQAIGRAKDRGRAIAHIKERARALDASDELPEGWVKREDDDNVLDMTGLLKKTNHQETTMNAEVKKLIDDAVAAALKDTNDKITKSEGENAALKAQVAFLSMPAAHQEFAKAMSDEDKKKFAEKKAEDREEEMEKAKKAAKQTIDPAIAKRLAEADEDRKILKTLQEREEVRDFEKRASDLGLPADKAEVLRKAHHGDKTALKQIEDLLGSMNKALAEAQKSGKIFKEFGSHQQNGGTTALDQLNAKAAELRKADAKLSPQQAFAKVYEDPANAELVTQEKAERNSKMGVAA